jgi:hypothetical protein
MQQGHSHEYEPDADSLSYIDFENWDGTSADLTSDDDGTRRVAHVEAAIAALGEAGVQVLSMGAALVVDDLFAEYDVRGETLFWSYVEDLVNAAGFDTYNSDSRFEVFPAGTPVATIEPRVAADEDITGADLDEDTLDVRAAAEYRRGQEANQS